MHNLMYTCSIPVVLCTRHVYGRARAVRCAAVYRGHALTLGLCWRPVEFTAAGRFAVKRYECVNPRSALLSLYVGAVYSLVLGS